MRKDFKNRNATRRRTPAQNRGRWVILAGSLGGLLVVSGLIAAFSMRPELMQHWVNASRHHLHQDIAKVKELAAKQKEGPPPIHFEFYTALPKMQVGSALPVSKPQPAPVAKIKPVIVSANELEQELSAHIKQYEATKKRQ
ncbi:MAG: hypothetical protein WAW86_06000 [Gammaproteobacteria bacterium]